MPAQRKKKIFFRSGLTSKNLLRYFLFIAAIILIIGAALRLFSLYKTRAWQGNTRFTIVRSQNPPGRGLEIVSYQDPLGLVTISVPGNLEVDASYNAGRLRIESLYRLGRLQGTGAKLLVLTLQNTFGIPIDGWIIEGETNLSLFDRTRVEIVLRATPGAARRVVSLEPTFERDLVDTKVAEEGIGVGVVNRSGKAGLGRKVSQVVEGMGAPILWIRTEEEVAERCLVRGSQKTLDSLTAKKINRLFSCRVEEDQVLASSIELILGKEIAPEFP